MYKALHKVRGMIVFAALITFLFSVIYSIVIRGFDGLSLLAIMLSILFFGVDFLLDSRDE